MNILYHPSIEKFIQRLQKPTQAKMLRQFDLLEKYGPDLGMPHVKKIKNKLFELRIRGIQEIRFLFITKGDKALILHGFIKKSQKTPIKEIKTATKHIP